MGLSGPRSSLYISMTWFVRVGLTHDSLMCKKAFWQVCMNA